MHFKRSLSWDDRQDRRIGLDCISFGLDDVMMGVDR